MSLGNALRIEMDPATFRRILWAERAVTGRSAEFMISRAATEAAKQAKESLGERVRQRYNGSFPGGTKGRARVKKGSVGHPGAELIFKSGIPAIVKFRATPRATPTKFLKGDKTVRHFVQGKKADKTFRSGFAKVGPQKKYSVKVSQLSGTGMVPIKDAFIVLIGEHKGVYFREKKTRFPIEQVLGSSDKAMVRQDEVYGAEEPRISQIFVEQCEKQIEAALAKG